MTRGRIILLVLLAWALAMVAPDLRRVLRPSGSLGLHVNNDGLIYDVVGPFRSSGDSPAWQAGLRPGDRLDLGRMRCVPYEAQRCADALAVLGGVRFLAPGRRVTLDLAATAAAPARRVALEARQRPSNWVVRGVLLLGGLAAIAVLLATAWLVWRRPGRMSWGFFLYAMWFNPGQVVEFYAALQVFPPLMLAQGLIAAVAQAAGYTGLLQFALRVPRDEVEPRFARLERLLPWVAAVLAVPLLASLGSLVGFGTELMVRASLLAGLAVAVAAVVILAVRRPGLPPIERQRLRWVLWGCLIGLPAFVIGELGQQTTIFLLGEDRSPSDEVSALLALVNGVLFLFVFEALRRPRVVNVAIPLRRVTVLGLVFSVPTLLLHHWTDQLQRTLALPEWGWLLVGPLVLFLISRLHHLAAERTDALFNRRLDRAGEECGRKVLHARSLGEVEALLVGAQQRLLDLASAAVFWRAGEDYHRTAGGHGWDVGTTSELRAGNPLLAPLGHAADDGGGHATAEPFALPEALADGLPDGLARPVLAVPIANRLGVAGVALYGPHESGADLDANEREMLGRLGGLAADARLGLELAALRRRVAELGG
jgi:energy-converting hydrogenase Eha subunit A